MVTTKRVKDSLTLTTQESEALNGQFVGPLCNFSSLCQQRKYTNTLEETRLIANSEHEKQLPVWSKTNKYIQLIFFFAVLPIPSLSPPPFLLDLFPMSKTVLSKLKKRASNAALRPCNGGVPNPLGGQLRLGRLAFFWVELELRLASLGFFSQKDLQCCKPISAQGQAAWNLLLSMDYIACVRYRSL